MDFLLKAEMVAVLALFIGIFNLKIWKEWHHGYAGIAFFFGAYTLGWWPVMILALLVTLDDAWEHLYQDFIDDRTYQSPLKQLYGKYLWPLPWVQKLNKWLDGIFSKL